MCSNKIGLYGQEHCNTAHHLTDIFIVHVRSTVNEIMFMD